MAMNPNKAVVIGAGTMGASLAQVYALAGFTVAVYDIVESALEKGKKLIALNQETMLAEELITQEESDAAMARISFTLDKACFADCAIVIENVVERMEVKKSVFAEISRLVPEEALLATNTSGLKITEIATACYLPERFMGQHWLNPPHIIPLCEIIAGEKTSKENLARMRELINRLGKKPITVADINGFVTNRLQFAMLREALHIVDIGAATAEDVDTALTAGMGLRLAALGPFGVADFGGLDTFDHINRYLNADLCDSKEGNTRLHKMVEEGHLGVKSGRGFYDYEGDKADAAIRARDKQYIELAKLLYFKK